MSNAAIKTPLQVARDHAERIAAMLRPHCTQIDIAGSIRRQKPEVSDIEIVCIPALEPVGLFADQWQRKHEFVEAVAQLPRIKGNASDGRYTQRRDPHSGMAVDIFMAAPDNYGLILILRTGSADFNQQKLLVALKNHRYTMRDGQIWNHKGERIPTPTEEAVFALAGMDWVAPEKRVVALKNKPFYERA